MGRLHMLSMRPARRSETLVGLAIGLSVALMAVSGIGVTETAAQDRVLFDNYNKQSVQNGVPEPPTFTINETTVITHLQTYHWNNGQGHNKAGWIGIVGQRWWRAEGRPGMNGVPNAEWIAKPNIQLPPGTYRIVDTSMPTWSMNAGSSGVGFAHVLGRAAAAGPSAGMPPPASGSVMNVAGRYEMSGGGYLDLRQTGSKVTGEWSNGAKIVEAKVEGDRVSGTYRYRPHTGLATFNFAFTPDGRCYEGPWRDGGQSGIEKGCRPN